MQINTQQLRTALQTASQNIANRQQNRTGDARVENLDLKNVYISSKGEVHVSKGGWNRMWAGLMGRPTGAVALRQAMTGRDGNGFNIPDEVADRALQNITKFQTEHSQWAQGHRPLEEHLINKQSIGIFDPNLQAEVERSKAEEPTRNLEGMFQMPTEKKDSRVDRAIIDLKRPLDSIPEATEEAENELDQPTTTEKREFLQAFAGDLPGGPSKPVADKQSQPVADK